MGLGVLEAAAGEHVPGEMANHSMESRAKLICSAGTSFVLDDASRPSQTVDLDTRLKYDQSGPVPIILVPQPSDDPNDPLVSYSLF